MWRVQWPCWKKSSEHQCNKDLGYSKEGPLFFCQRYVLWYQCNIYNIEDKPYLGTPSCTMLFTKIRITRKTTMEQWSNTFMVIANTQSENAYAVLIHGHMQQEIDFMLE